VLASFNIPAQCEGDHIRGASQEIKMETHVKVSRN